MKDEGEQQMWRGLKKTRLVGYIILGKIYSDQFPPRSHPKKSGLVRESYPKWPDPSD